MKTLLHILFLIFIINLNSFAQSLDLQKGLVAYFPFDGNAVDETGSGNTGIVNGATLTSDRNGKPNAAYKFVNTPSGRSETQRPVGEKR